MSGFKFRLLGFGLLDYVGFPSFGVFWFWIFVALRRSWS